MEGKMKHLLLIASLILLVASAPSETTIETAIALTEAVPLIKEL
jgi:hypothetical protein